MKNLQIVLSCICLYFGKVTSRNSQTSKPYTQLKYPKHILELGFEEQNEFIHSFDLLLTDIDGVLWLKNTSVPNAVDAITLLRNAGKRCAFISNNALETEEDFIEKFKIAGVKFNLNTDLLNPEKNIISFILENDLANELIYCIASESFKNSLRTAGFNVCNVPDVKFTERVSSLSEFIMDGSNVKVVIIDFDINITGTKLLRAQYYLMKNPDSILIVGAADWLAPLTPNFNIIGPGYFANLLSEISGKTPIRLGKLGPELCQIIKNKFGIHDSKRILLVVQDFRFGNPCAFQTLAVLSGGTTVSDLRNPLYSHEWPDYYADRLGDFLLLYNFLWKNH